MKEIEKILIVNRSEIASRIIKTCREMGISTVAVHSEADKNSPFVQQANEAFALLGNTAEDTYLNQDKIIEAAKQTNSDAIHPGYGFLAENPAFAQRCEKEKIQFIGPSSKAIRQMGSKAKAKDIMAKSGVPVIAGYSGKDQHENTLIKEAVKLGFPILLKPSAGGGGKGMHIIREKKELKTSIKTAKREAKAAFGNDHLIIEKYYDSCRHIEIQIFGDEHGNIITLGERECTIQRRYQKIIEESPSPALSQKLRSEINQAGIQAAKSIGYTNAGTVEFILNNKNEFFFLEMNTRLQVEHPVTEMVSGLDLVKLQIQVAEGKNLKTTKALNGTQNTGYALECRLYAEDPNNGFLPETGKILNWATTPIEGVRYDSGIKNETVISSFYDPMLAKIIAHADTRAEAFRKMRYALNHLTCLGVKTNKEYLIHLLQNKAIQKGNYDTHFVNDFEFTTPLNTQEASIVAMLWLWHKKHNKRNLLANIPTGWRNNYYQHQFHNFKIGDAQVKLEYRNSENNIFEVPGLDGKIEFIEIKNNTLTYAVNRIQKQVLIATQYPYLFIHFPATGQVKVELIERFPSPNSPEKQKGDYTAPMPGQIVKLLVKKNQAVKKGEPLVIINSMKMENSIEAHSNGTVKQVFIKEKTQVEADTLLLKIEE